MKNFSLGLYFIFAYGTCLLRCMHAVDLNGGSIDIAKERMTSFQIRWQKHDDSTQHALFTIFIYTPNKIAITISNSKLLQHGPLTRLWNPYLTRLPPQKPWLPQVPNPPNKCTNWDHCPPRVPSLYFNSDLNTDKNDETPTPDTITVKEQSPINQCSPYHWQCP